VTLNRNFEFGFPKNRGRTLIEVLLPLKVEELFFLFLFQNSVQLRNCQETSASLLATSSHSIAFPSVDTFSTLFGLNLSSSCPPSSQPALSLFTRCVWRRGTMEESAQVRRHEVGTGRLGVSHKVSSIFRPCAQKNDLFAYCTLDGGGKTLNVIH
jgi:hypothetical protein